MNKKGVDRNQLCSDLDLKYMTVSDWINAKSYPRIDKIELLANYFGINKSDLIEDKTLQLKFGEALFHTIAENHTETAIIKQYLNWLETL